jgi:ArsR family transcriptional regulator, zinc-responsive transcriptional repressor
MDRKILVLKAVAHPVRLGIVATLAQSPTHVGALAEALGVPQPVVSQQLRVLRMSGLVSPEPRDGFVVYRLREPHLRSLLSCIESCCGHH